jgi:hypothetical protein
MPARIRLYSPCRRPLHWPERTPTPSQMPHLECGLTRNNFDALDEGGGVLVFGASDTPSDGTECSARRKILAVASSFLLRVDG